MTFLEELKRRKVFRVGAAYLVVAWVLLQLTDLVFENLGAPDWVMRAVMLLLVIGLPVALVLAWVFEVTPEGVQREESDPVQVGQTAKEYPTVLRRNSRGPGRRCGFLPDAGQPRFHLPRPRPR